LGDSTQAEDVAQEAFVRLWQELTTGSEPANIRAWIFRVASNFTVSRFRIRARTLRLFLPSHFIDVRPPLSDVNVEREAARRQIVERVLQRLPEPMRQCLLLHEEGLSGREIAEILRVKPSYVNTLVFRAHERFRRECDTLGGRDGLLG